MIAEDFTDECRFVKVCVTEVRRACEQKFELCLVMLLAHKGGFVEHPDDRGATQALG